MLTIITAPIGPLSAADARGLVPRARKDDSSVVDVVARLVEDVRTRGEVALREQSEKFDGGSPIAFRVSNTELSLAAAELDPALRDAITVAIERVTAASKAQVPSPSVTTLAPGAEIAQEWIPVDRVGLYVPGGKAVYPSSVVMNVVAAQVAGVRSIALVSPPQHAHAGSVHPTVAAVARMLGVDEVYAMGGAGAIGALAFGVPSLELEPVSVITGPGNEYVSAAKRVVSAVVGIDSEAGPTEILIIADDSAEADLIAADLISQAEHDELASAVLVTTSPELAERVVARTAARTALTHHRVRVEAALSGEQSRVIVVNSLADAIAVSDAYAPEHLEIHTVDADDVARRIRHAGVIFVGPSTPVALGDYLAGSNHVLPTQGHARHAAGLGPFTFLRPRQTVRYSREALHDVSDAIVTFARSEDLPAHGDAVTARFER